MSSRFRLEPAGLEAEDGAPGPEVPLALLEEVEAEVGIGVISLTLLSAAKTSSCSRS